MDNIESHYREKLKEIEQQLDQLNNWYSLAVKDRVFNNKDKRWLKMLSNIGDTNISYFSQKETDVLIRYIVFYVARHYENMTFEYIAEKFEKDHSTVFYGIRKIKGYLSIECKEKYIINDIVNKYLKNVENSTK